MSFEKTTRYKKHCFTDTGTCSVFCNYVNTFAYLIDVNNCSVF